MVTDAMTVVISLSNGIIKHEDLQAVMDLMVQGYVHQFHIITGGQIIVFMARTVQTLPGKIEGANV